jgi:hypothetical protein
VEDGLGLTTITGLLSIVTTLSCWSCHFPERRASKFRVVIEIKRVKRKREKKKSVFSFVPEEKQNTPNEELSPYPERRAKPCRSCTARPCGQCASCRSCPCSRCFWS